MPTGPELKRLIRDGDQSAIIESSPRYWAALRDGLEGTQQSSIDAFLGLNKGLATLGKQAIACALLPREREAALRTREEDGKKPLNEGWYQWFCNQLPLDQPPERWRVQIVTFNYDQTLELAIALSLIHDHNMQPRAAWHRVKQLPIVHVYGTLWSGDAIEVSERRVCPPRGKAAAVSAAETIRVVDFERREPLGAEVEIAREWLRESEQLVFLGFGYDSSNLGLLGFPKVTEIRVGFPRQYFKMSGYGVYPSERTTAESRVSGILRGSPYFVWSDIRESCEQFLRSYVVF